MDWSRNQEILKILAGMQTRDAYRYLLELWEKSDGSTRALCLRHLVEFDSAAVQNILREATTDTEPLVRAAALEILRTRPGLLDEEILYRAVDDEEPSVAREAILCLKQVDTPKSLETICRFIKSDNETLVEAALESLTGRKEAFVINQILTVLPRASERIRILAIRLLAPFANLKIMDALVKMWARATIAERVSIIYVISLIDDMRATNVLMDIFKNGDQTVKIAVCRNLRRISTRFVRVFLSHLIVSSDFMADILLNTLVRLIEYREDLKRTVMEYCHEVLIDGKSPFEEKEVSETTGKFKRLGQQLAEVIKGAHRSGLGDFVQKILNVSNPSEFPGLRTEALRFMEREGLEEHKTVIIELFELKYQWQRKRVAETLNRELSGRKVPETEVKWYHLARLLAAIPRQETRTYLEEIYFMSLNTQEKVRVLESMGKTGLPECEEFLLKRFEEIDSVEEKIGLVRALGMIKTPASLRKIRSCIDSPEPELRLVAVIGIAGFEPDVQLLYFKKAFNDPDPRIRSFAVLKLGELHDRRLLKDFFKMLEDEDDRVRANAIEAIDLTIMPLLDKMKTIRYVKPYLNSPNNRVRGNACKLLFRFIPDDVWRSIREMVASEDKWTRASAAWVLGEIEAVKSVHYLAILLQDPDRRVRANAVKSLVKQKKEEVRSEAFKVLLDLGEKGLLNFEEDIETEIESEATRVDIASVLKGLRKKRKSVE